MSAPVKTRDWMSPQLDQPVIHYRADNGIAVVEMDDPPANTYTYAMMRQLDDAVLKARFDDDVHVLILRGKGDRFFTAGANIGMLNAVTSGFKYFFCLHANETLLRFEHTPKLVIAALNGHTVGGGSRSRWRRTFGSLAKTRARSACPRSRWASFRGREARRAWPR